MAMRIFIADDDAGMRLVLRRLLEGTDGVELIGEAGDGAEALRACLELRPDAVFFEVEMPGLSGVEAARELRAALPDTAILFVTAHGEYMPEAFELYADDYLVKPFKADRVRQTLRRLQRRAEKRRAAPGGSLLLHGREEMRFVPIREIILVSRSERTTRIVTAEEVYTTSEPLSALWARLEPCGFLRSHRAFIINPAKVTRVLPYGRWSYTLRFRGTQEEALITKEKLDELESTLTQD